MGSEKVKNKGRNKGYDNLIPIKKGERLNPNGRPKGQRDYATIYREALIKLGTINNKTPEELEEEMLSNGIKLGRAGDYRFYKDILDRLHGTAVQVIDNKTAVTIDDITKSKTKSAISRFLSRD
jgi:hypothetical protein